MKNLKLPVGQTIQYKIPCSGEPLPEVIWTVNGKQLKPSNRCKITIERGLTKLKVWNVFTVDECVQIEQNSVFQIENAVRGDSGQYTLTLKNPSGEASCTARVLVVSKPSPPIGPITIDKINKEGALLGWKPPEDDGGEPIEG